MVTALQALAPPIAHAEHVPGATYSPDPGIYQASVTVSDDGTGITRFAVAGHFDGRIFTPNPSDVEAPCSVDREFEATYDPPLPIVDSNGHRFSDAYTAPDSSYRLDFYGDFTSGPGLRAIGEFQVVFPAGSPTEGLCTGPERGTVGSGLNPWFASFTECCQPDSTAACDKAKQKVKKAKQKLKEADSPDEKQKAKKKLKKAKRKEKEVCTA